MDTLHSPLWTHLSSEERLTGTWRAELPAYQDQPSPCLGACPVNGNIATWIGQVKSGDTYGAFVTLADNNPFPAIAGRICHHPCETACNRIALDETVGICSLERFVGDTALAKHWVFPAPEVERSGSVAIVGGGPAGLSAAYQLRRYGFRVTLYEAADQLGGLMRYGIPTYRLDRAVLDGEIDRITAMGVDIRLNAEVMDGDALEGLCAAHDAVLLATGASLPKVLPDLDYNQPYVIDSAKFLAAPMAVQSELTGDHVLVIGGGSAAMDAARTARRLGRTATVLTLEPKGRLPAQQVELDEAAEEGIAFVNGAMLQSAVPDGDTVSLDCIKVDFQAAGQRGQFRVDPRPGTEFSLSANTIIPAIGQDADLARWDGVLGADGPVIATLAGWQTSKPGLFAGGDVASMNRFVTQAIGVGKEAAHAIAAALDPAVTARPPATSPLVDYDRINTAYQESHARIAQPVTDVQTRLSSFAEVQQPLDNDQARTEAARCFSCGTCIFCDNCLFYCPDMAITKLGDGYEVKVDYCKGCGLCVAECPTGSIHMQKDVTQ
jgi:NADPH-dependent glutamate synthase beta subunit-like oxidoreductase